MTSTKKLHGHVVLVSVSDRKGVKKANVDNPGDFVQGTPFESISTK